MRELIIDTETTGVDHFADRIVEIGAVEIVNLVPTGRTFHTYLNPLRDVSPGAFKVHGLSNDFLRDKPYFQEVIEDFIDFIGDDQLVAHNAEFDLRFFNAELKRIGRPELHNPVVDTLPLAREVKKGGYHNLDALCNYFGIDRTKRTKHGALLDSEILAEVYLRLRGGRQFGMELTGEMPRQVEEKAVAAVTEARPFSSQMTDDEAASFKAALARIKQPIWSQYLEKQPQAGNDSACLCA